MFSDNAYPIQTQSGIDIHFSTLHCAFDSNYGEHPPVTAHDGIC